LVTDLVPSQLLPEDLPVLIYLPPCYFALPEAQYPTLYLIHGQSFNQDQWVRMGAAEFADEIIAAGEAAPFLIVMPYVADWSQPTGYPFGQALVEEVLPYIETYYQASSLRPDRAIGGLSRGGSWALHIGTRYWDLFGTLGGHSAPVFLDDGALIDNWLEAIPAGLAPRIYLDIATSEESDIRASVLWFTDELDVLGIEYEFHEYPGYHSEYHWSTYTEEYLRFYAAEWRP
jgi:enterochelin esterase-like enzyme